MTEEKRDQSLDDNENAPVKPDPETLHKTDPQENMKGPVSSAMHKTAKTFETDKSQEQANKERDKNM